jgi:SpoVK/Ycf46/Vps4 family AAA+-type ATPase
LIDSALLARLSEVEIHVGRPNLAGARRIFEIHLPPDLLYAGDAHARTVLIDRAVSRLYSPNGDNQLSVLRFRNGATRTMAARDLMSGRLIDQLCQDACRAALRHDRREGEVGLTTRDLDEAIGAALEKLATTLTPRNCRAYLDDLPQDVDVVSVERIARPVPRRHDYVSAA